MITIDLDENEDVVLVPDMPEVPKEISTDFEFKKKLIFLVRKRPLLYDNKHKQFSNVSKKDLVWQQIADKLNSNADKCKETWFELRYHYQRHARRLRNYFVQNHKENFKRPAMLLESELMFLWRVVDDRKTCEIAFEITEDKITQNEKECSSTVEKTSTITNQKQVDDDLILVETPVELIVIDEDDDNAKTGKQFKMNNTMRNLIALIKTHPEIYDSKHKDFNNFTRKSFLWNAIASTMSDKATKLMKCWIVMQTRYEWEICQQKAQTLDESKAADSELQRELNFFKNFILNDHDTVYKQSYFLKFAWHEPIDYFKDIYNLIVRMKKTSEIVCLTDSLIQSPEKNKRYISLWTEIANIKNCTPGQCETTWLIMRHFYWQLMNMRQENYQLTDKWYFETIIKELSAISKAGQRAKQLEHEALKSHKQSKKPSKRSAPTKEIALGAPANKRSSPIAMPMPISTVTTEPSSMPVLPAMVNNFQNSTAPNSTPSIQSANQPTLTLPKITAAISLAPQALNSGSLQIKQISGPPALSPAPFQLNNSTNATISAPNTVVSTPMSMSFNLPTQTKVTPIPMPTLIRPVVPNPPLSVLRNTTPATISVRPSLPQIQIAPWATAPKPSLSSNVVTQIHTNLRPSNSIIFSAPQIKSNLQPTPTAPRLLNSILGPQMPYNQQQNAPFGTYSPISPTNSDQAIASYKMTAPPLSNTTPNSNNVNGLLTPPASAPPAETNSSQQLPKISGAISLLNPNEILIELISSQNGNVLVVHGPPLTAKYQLPMKVVAKFIREVMAIPMLHTKQHVQPKLINHYWDHISAAVSLPVHICRAIWNFLLENFDHFPQIAPMKELMKPFGTTLKVWVPSTTLFEQFDKMCSFKDWQKYSKSFPDVVECISAYPCLYQDVAKEKSTEKLNDMEALCIWRTIALRFPKNSEIQEVWNAIKTCFLQYMSDLEIGIDNKWPINWWRSLARMKFLVEAKYTTNEPFYYIITNKMLEEIDKFATLEMRNRRRSEESPSDNNNAVAEPDNIEMEIMASVISTNDKTKEVELGTLLSAILKNPDIYNKTDILEKYEAWRKVSEELHMAVPDCIFAFRKATEKYLTYKKRDPFNLLHMNGKYFKRFDELIQSMPCSKFTSTCRAKIIIKTPFELNQSSSGMENSTDLVFPNRFISDINMSNSPSDLVVKNWIYALGNIANSSDTLTAKLKVILKRYLPNIN